MRKTHLLAALLVLGAANAAVAGDRPGVPWAESWEAAVAEAAHRNVPILLTFHKEY